MSHEWDEFSKSLAEPLPRRESLRRLGIVVTGAVLSPLGLDTAFAGRPDPCKAFCKCRNKRQQDQCVRACKACNKDTSRLCGSCGSYVCCGSGRACCSGYCTDLADDVLNCGACGFVCDEPGPYEHGACIGGECTYVCAEGADYRDGVCTCMPDCPPGWCGDDGCGGFCACPDGLACHHPSNSCYAPTPPPSQCTPDHPYWPSCCNDSDADCQNCVGAGGALCGGSCTDILSDPANCGACGNVCGTSTSYCSGGQCFDDNCAGADLNWDSNNCGTCGNVCAWGTACVWGWCQGGGGE